MRAPPPNYGPYPSEQAALRVIVDRLVEGLNSLNKPFRIYLFGSRAEGRARPDSDFDLLVAFDDRAPNADADYDEVYAPLLEFGIGCDVIPCRWSDFQEVLVGSDNEWRLRRALGFDR
jgi:predicted nucleotidyltransferase